SCRNRGVDWNRRLLDHHADAGLPGDLVERGGKAASGWIAQHMNIAAGIQHGADEAVQGGGVGYDGRGKAETLAFRHDGHTVIAQRAREQNAVAGARPITADIDALAHDADARGGDKNAVALALFDDLGVTRDHRNT